MGDLCQASGQTIGKGSAPLSRNGMCGPWRCAWPWHFGDEQTVGRTVAQDGG
jgi:hypothetical protein